MVFLALLCLVLAVVFGGAYYAYRLAFYAPKSGRDQLPSLNARQYDPYREEISRIVEQLQQRECETVTIFSHDGLKLSGRYYHVKDGAPLDIGFHGYRSSCLTDFSGGSQLSLDMGHNLLLVDQRAHGKSEGRTISFGILERQDVLNWVYYALERFGPETEILLYGVSMGGAAVVMASDLELPPNVKGIVADCPFANPMEIILEVARKRQMPVALVRPFVYLGAKLYGGFDLRETDAIRAAKNTKVPILILHGEADKFVPCAMSRRIAEANPSKVTYCAFPGAEHGLSFLTDPEKYRNTVEEFVKSVL